MIFYRGPNALVTHEVIVSHGATYQQFALRELSDFHTRRRSLAELVGASQPVRIFSAGLAGTAVVVAVTSGVIINWPQMLAAASVVAVLAVVIALVGREFRTRHQQLWAFYRGEFVCVFSTPDARIFRQVTRAMARALEWRRERA
jgi:hypothetical protein